MVTLYFDGAGADGVTITGTDSDANRVENNIIGANRVRSPALLNANNEVAIRNGTRRNVITSNRIEGNIQQGVLLNGVGANSNKVLNNFIGSSSQPNNMNGIRVDEGAQNNEISGNPSGNNMQNGLRITGPGTQGTVAAENGISENRRSGAALENGAALNIIGGAVPSPVNIIKDNLETGIVIIGVNDNQILNDTISYNNLAGVVVVIISSVFQNTISDLKLEILL